MWLLFGQLLTNWLLFILTSSHPDLKKEEFFIENWNPFSIPPYLCLRGAIPSGIDFCCKIVIEWELNHSISLLLKLCLCENLLSLPTSGFGCGTTGRAVASNTVEHGFEYAIVNSLQNPNLLILLFRKKDEMRPLLKWLILKLVVCLKYSHN